MLTYKSMDTYMFDFDYMKDKIWAFNLSYVEILLAFVLLKLRA